MIWLAVILALVALLASVPLTPNWIPAPRVAFVAFMVSLTGQIFALPLSLVAATLAAFTEGAAGWLLAGAAILAAVAHWRNRSAGRLLLDAANLAQPKIPLLAGLVPFLTGSSNVRRIRDLPYGDAGKRNLLDLVLPRTTPAEPMPILLHVHGGGWSTGGKNEQAKPLLHHLAARGWLCVDINYRLIPTERLPAMIVDVLKAIAWVKAHAHEYGGDSARIAITGGSAGGHLAALAALAHDDPALKPGFETADCSVSCAILNYGFYDLFDRDNPSPANRTGTVQYLADNVMPGPPDAFPALWRALSPIDRIRTDAPPMLLTHGTADALQPLRNARAFAGALQTVSSAPVKLVELPGIEHAYDMGATALTWAHVRAVESFLAPLTGRAQSSGEMEPGGAPLAVRETAA